VLERPQFGGASAVHVVYLDGARVVEAARAPTAQKSDDSHAKRLVPNALATAGFLTMCLRP
jgi:hypothetical protein